MVEINKRTPDLMTKYGIKANPIDAREGLENVFQGWEELKVSHIYYFILYADE